MRTPDEALTALHFLETVIAAQRHRHPLDNAAALQARFDAGEVRLRDGARLRPESIIPPHTDVWFYRIPAPEIEVPYPMPVVHEDERIVVVNKPPFLASMPRGQHIVQTALVRLRRQMANDELSPAHRLDRMTGGLLLFTKAREFRGAYQQLFASGQVTKTYEAVAPWAQFDAPVRWMNHMEKRLGVLQTRVGPALDAAEEGAAMTDLLRVEPLGGAEEGLARYVLQPHTGKTHQLRAHMSFHGVPIVGDPLYPEVTNRNPMPGDPVLRLTAVRLEFIDPYSGRELVISLP